VIPRDCLERWSADADIDWTFSCFTQGDQLFRSALTRSTRAFVRRAAGVGIALSVACALLPVAPSVASAAGRVVPAVVVTSKPDAYGDGERVVIGGRAAGAPVGTAVTLQRSSQGKWAKVATVKATSKGAFVVTYKAGSAKATARLRVVVGATRQVKSAKSGVFGIRPRDAVHVSATLAGGPFVKGDVVTVSGTVAGTTSAVAVRLEELRGATWHAVRSGRTSSRGSYSLATSAGTSSRFLRVVAPEVGRRDAGVSRSVTASHYACVAGTAPVGGMAARFNTPISGSGRELSSLLVGTACAAATGATISVSTYILAANDPEPARILTALRSVAVERGVHVRFVLELQGSGITSATVRQLRRFANVVTCKGGCITRAADAAQMHDKVFAVSDTRWSPGKDPAVILGSSNWSTRQFHQYWQTAALFHGDKALYAAHVAKFDLMRRCATSRCSASQVRATVATDPGRGMTLHFFPQSSGDETVATMRTVGCVPGSHVSISMYIASGSRISAVTKQLRRLVEEGCDVDVLMSDGGAYATSSAGLAEVRKTGASLRCVTLSHAKFAVYRGVTVGGRTGQAMVTDGSQNWTTSGLRRNDDSTFTLSTAQASGGWQARIKAMASSYEAGWRAIASRSHRCS